LAAQPPVGNPPNAINYNVVDYDTDSLFVNTANGTEFVAPIDGIYHLDATALFNKVASPVSVPNPSVAIHVYKYSGSSWAQYVMLGQDNATGNVNSGVTQQEYYSCVGGHDVKLLAGERLRIVPFMNFSNSITTTSISGYTFSSWSVHYVGDWQ
jgi:hypothetical protein